MVSDCKRLQCPNVFKYWQCVAKGSCIEHISQLGYFSQISLSMTGFHFIFFFFFFFHSSARGTGLSAMLQQQMKSDHWSWRSELVKRWRSSTPSFSLWLWLPLSLCCITSKSWRWELGFSGTTWRVRSCLNFLYYSEFRILFPDIYVYW